MFPQVACYFDPHKKLEKWLSPARLTLYQIALSRQTNEIEDKNNFHE